MAFYGDKTKVIHATDHKDVAKYSRSWNPGDRPAYPGIYKCQRCGFEDVINRECYNMPRCAECRADTTTWKLLVRAMDR
jgi:hypothetical protein